jgi:hypothetical protein
VLKLELLEGKFAEEIGEIWKTFFLNKDSVSAVIPAQTFTEMEPKLKQFSTVNYESVLWKM